MNDPVLGEAMEQNRSVPWILLVFPAMMLFAGAPTAWSLLRGDTSQPWGSLAMLAAMAGMALGVLWLRHALLDMRIHVGPEAVTRTWRGEVKHVLRYADITRVRLDRQLNIRQWRLTMDGPDPYGRPLWFTVSTMYASNLELLLRRLDQEVARRPEILQDHDRVLWTSYPR